MGSRLTSDCTKPHASSVIHNALSCELLALRNESSTPITLSTRSKRNAICSAQKLNVIGNLSRFAERGDDEKDHRFGEPISLRQIT